MDPYLINLASFVGYEDISINVKPERMLVFVRKAQELDLELFMGAAFYTDFIQYFSNDLTTGALITDPACPQAYKDLFNGKRYTDLAGHAVRYNGIIPALIYWTFARFIEADSVHYTSTGPVQKRHDSADAIEQRDITKIVAAQRSVANAHANKIEMFLENNRSLFPLWRFNASNKSSRQPGARVRAIDVTAYNRAGYGNSNYGLGGYNEFL